MKVPFVDLKAHHQEIKAELDETISNVIAKSAFIKGEFVSQFEKEFATYIGAKSCVGVANGTDALHISLRVLGVTQGAEVIVPANSFIATSEAVSLAGARPVFVDCDPAFYNIDVGQLERAITKKTKAIIAVHLYGRPAAMDEIAAFAIKHGLHLIEDAAQAHGATYKGRRVGTFGACGCFSFFPGKNLGALGDAGAIVCNDPALAERFAMYANHGRKEKYSHEQEGVNSRLDGLQAAILSIKLKQLERWNARRRAVAQIYDEALGSMMSTPAHSADHVSSQHLYVVRVKNRDALQKKLKECGIETGIHYPIPLHMLPAYKYLGHKAEDFPVAAKFKDEILSLPIHGCMPDDQVKFVVDTLRETARG